MSSIIDALKKSDNNRTNETGANVNQINFNDHPPEKKRRGFWLLLILLLLVVAGVFAWTQEWHRPVIDRLNIRMGSASTESTSNQADNQQQPENVSTQPQPSDSRYNNKLTPPQADAVKARSQAVKQAETSSARQHDLEVISNNIANTDNTNQPAKDTAPTGEEETIEVTPKNATEPTNNDNTADAVVAAEEENRQALRPQLQQDYLLIHQIDFQIRKNIPPVKLNIHIYDPEPENRMVIINGVKYATGDSIEDLVTVEEINQQGVVLTFEGVRFLIPK